MNKHLTKTKNNEALVNILKGSFVAISISLISILIFAFVIKLTNLSDKFIPIVNQIIKIISIFFGVLSATKYNKTKGLVKGVSVALIYTILSFVIFATLSKSFPISFAFFYDILFGMIIGAICGIFAVNLKK